MATTDIRPNLPKVHSTDPVIVRVVQALERLKPETRECFADFLEAAAGVEPA